MKQNNSLSNNPLLLKANSLKNDIKFATGYFCSELQDLFFLTFFGKSGTRYNRICFSWPSISQSWRLKTHPSSNFILVKSVNQLISKLLSEELFAQVSEGVVIWNLSRLLIFLCVRMCILFHMPCTFSFFRCDQAIFFSSFRKNQSLFTFFFETSTAKKASMWVIWYPWLFSFYLLINVQ